MPTVPRRAAVPPAVLVAPAAVCLLAGLNAALALLDLPAPVAVERLTEVHGMLLVLGFVGTLVALERSLALGARWAVAAPAGFGFGGVALLSPLDLQVGQTLLVVGAIGLIAGYLALWRRQPSEALLVQAGGAVTAAGAAVLWLGGVDVPVLLPWLVGFVVLTIAGERLELARVVAVDGERLRTFLAAAGGVLVAGPLTLLWPDAGTPLAGLALLGLVGWLLANDVARRTVRLTGQPRFMAACLLAGYAWLVVAAVSWLFGPAVDGPRYDTIVHAVFLGFTISMIMAHAPVILPAVLRRPLPYHPAMWVPAALLQVSLVLRIGVGDARALTGIWRLGGVLGVTAVLLFVATVVVIAVIAGTGRAAGQARR